MSAAASPRLLVVDDEPDLRTLYELALLREGHDVDSAGSVAEGWQLLEQRNYDVLITDMRLPDGTGLDLLQRLDQRGRRERVVVITAYGSPENAVQALKAGAFDYLTKPVDLRQFRTVVASALQRHLGDAPARPAEPARGGAPRPAASPRRQMAGTSAAMAQVRALVDKVARSMAPVLIQGESGTGKELVARSIHQQGPRAARPFVAVNCGAIPEALLEAEFFGYRKGAFTGAHEDREGFFQAAAGGTLFLDEIGEMPLSMQSKLLRVIQERAVRPVGAVQELPVDVRIISATHKDLAQEVQAARFRQDLYYRLNVIGIRVPPLRERPEDVPVLAAHLLERIAADSGLAQVPRLTPTALDGLAAQRFPGNVRELENLLHRAVALSGGTAHEAVLLDVDDLGLASHTAPLVEAAREVLGGGVLSAASHLAAEVSGGDAATVPMAEAVAAPAGSRGEVEPAALPGDLLSHLDQVERGILIQALEAHRYNRTAAGASLGLTLRQMRYRMARLGIQEPGDAEATADPRSLDA